MPTLCVNDVIQFRATNGLPRIVTITDLGRDGFTGVITANKIEKVMGRYPQVLRVMKRADPDVDHKITVTEVGEGSVTWECACGHTETATRKTTEGAMQKAHTQQERHWAAMREVRGVDF